MTNRYVVADTYPNGQVRQNITKAEIGLGYAVSMALHNKWENVVIVVPRIGSFDTSDLGMTIDNLKIPNLTASRLRRHESVKIGGTNISVVSSTSIDSIRGVDVIIAYTSTPEDLARIDALYNVNNIVYIPWLANEEQEWKNKWNPNVI
ncbi:hypothetical protein [Acinetobacter soli]|uniref:hypothetical protein n=2 Tax=Acinetobacter soli TaxID=487316 RepID=UPI001D0B138C|nr:hypothetical protein [Acinetobacter soli]MCB8769398.1 hypothetical protein [Acinetobacter soli]